MSWKEIKFRSHKGGGHSRIKELTHKAKSVLEELCEEFDEMEEYFGERDDEMYEHEGREEYGERRRYRRY